LKILNWIALILLIIGGLNWLLVGLFRFDAFVLLTGPMTATTRIIYALVGIAAIYIAVISPKLMK
jgi:uncharacterized membrane protein YuzA (DUF378 family)